MRVWTNKKFEGVYSVGTAAVVVAEDAGAAAKLLEAALTAIGLRQTVSPLDFEAIDTTKPCAVILNDGDY